jgi:DNA-binding NarL/FixJ family response regulator
VTVRVLVVDDTEYVRDGMRMALDPAPEIEVVGEAGDGAAGVAEAERLRPDVVLMDVRMPVLDGIEATRALVALDGPPVRVLMLTTFDLDEYLFEALDAGVSGFTLKDTPPDELIAGIVAVARDDALVDAENTVRLIARHAHSRPAAPAPDLDAGERELLAQIAAGRSNAEIGAGDDAVAALLARLGVRDRIHAVLLAHRGRLAAQRAQTRSSS